MKRIDVDREVLSSLYCDKLLSLKEISKELNISQTQVGRLMRRYSITTRSSSKTKLRGRKKPSKEELEKLYWEDKLSTVEIGKRLNFPDNTIRRWMIENNIKRRSIHDSLSKFNISKEELEDLYTKQELSTNEIAKQFNLKDPERVRQKLIYYGIKRRDSIEVRTILVDLSPSPELAYILGVLKGDGGICGKFVIQLGTIDEVFAQSFYDALKKIGFNPRLSQGGVTTTNNRIYYTAGASKQFVGWYKKLTLETIHTIFLKDKKLTIEFLRGFYESEGHHHKRYGYIIIANSDLELLLLTQKILLSFGIISGIRGPYPNKRNPNWKSMYNIYINKTNTFHFFCSIKPVIKFKKELWEKSILTVVKPPVIKFKKELNVKKQIKYKIVNSREMNELLTMHSPYFIDQIAKNEITQSEINKINVPFASSNHKNYSIIYICPELIAELTQKEDTPIRNIFIEHCIIHELYHIKINDSYDNKSKEEEFIIKETRMKYPYQRKIYEKLAKNSFAYLKDDV